MTALDLARVRKALLNSILLTGLACAIPAHTAAQAPRARGHSIGRVSVRGKLIVVDLDTAALGRPNLFNLQGRTLRFTPSGRDYRVHNEPLSWDSAFGTQLSGSKVTLEHFTFPFSGRTWASLSVGASGSIRFAASSGATPLDPYGHPDAGVILG